MYTVFVTISKSDMSLNILRLYTVQHSSVQRTTDDTTAKLNITTKGAQHQQSHMYRETEDPSKSTEPTMALARRDLSSKRAHTTSEVSTSKECASGDRVQGGVTLPARPMSTSPSPAAHAAAHARAATADDAACSRDLEEVVAAGLQTCCANVCMTHVRTAARSHTLTHITPMPP